MSTAVDDIVRGVAVGGMFLIAIGAGLLFLVGGFFAGQAPSSAIGDVLMVASAVGFVSALIAGYGVIVGTPLRAALAATVQGITAILVLAWWVATDFWEGTAHADKSTLPLLAVLLLDAAVLVWAVRRLGVQEARS